MSMLEMAELRSDVWSSKYAIFSYQCLEYQSEATGRTDGIPYPPMSCNLFRLIYCIIRRTFVFSFLVGGKWIVSVSATLLLPSGHCSVLNAVRESRLASYESVKAGR